jgi:hypothetical protein
MKKENVKSHLTTLNSCVYSQWFKFKKSYLFYSLVLILTNISIYAQNPPGVGSANTSTASIPASFVNLASGNKTLSNQTFTSTEFWYRWQNTSTIPAININPIIQGNQFQIASAELYVSSGSYLILKNKVAINPINTLDLIAKDISPSSDVYIKLSSAQICSNCSGSPFPLYTIQFKDITPNCNYDQPSCELVVDGGFEKFNVPCANMAGFQMPWNPFPPCFWFQGIGFDGTPDYFNDCVPSGGLVNANYNYFNNYNFMTTHSGNGYVGIYAYDHQWNPTSGFGSDYREYVTQPLSSPLVQNTPYKISMWVKLSENSRHAIPSLQAVLSVGGQAIAFPNQNTINDQVINLTNSSATPINNLTNWVLLSANFIPNANYDYVLIGNYNDDATTALTPVNNSNSDLSYYFIDDVSIVPNVVNVAPVTTCPNQAVTLNFTGCPLSPNYSFDWDFGNGIISNSGSNPSISAVYTSAGVYSGVLTITNGNSSSTYPFTVTVLTPPTIVISPTSNNTCPNVSTTLNASGGLAYSWSPSGSTNSSINVNPTVPTLYSVSGTDAQGCISTTSFLVNPITCCTANGGNNLDNLTLGTNITGSYQLNSSIILPANFTIRDCRIYMGTNAELVVPNNGVLTISGSHLLGCPTMWKGIRFQGPNATIKITNIFNNKNTLIEDAITAIDLSNVTAPALGQTLIIQTDEATFNKNFVGLNIANYNTTSANYPSEIVNTVFTSRKLVTPEHIIVTPSSAPVTYNWPVTANVTNLKQYPQVPLASTNVNNYGFNPDATFNTNDQFSVASYLSSNLEIPYQTTVGRVGINLNAVYNFSGINNNGFVLAKANSLSLRTLNLFDNLNFGINADNSVVYSSNAAYQNMKQYETINNTSEIPISTYNGGIGIRSASNLTNGTGVGTPMWLFVRPNGVVGLNTSSNFFIHNAYGVKTNDVSYINITHTMVHSRRVNPSIGLPGIVPQGEYGVYAKTADYRNVLINSNFIANIRTAITFIADYAPGLVKADKNQFVGPVAIQNNTLKANYGNLSNLLGRSMYQGIVTDNILNQTTITGNVNGNPNAYIIQNNNQMYYVFSGITFSNWNGQRALAMENYIELAPTIFPSAGTTQYAIRAQNNTGDVINSNYILGFNVTKANVYAIWARDNKLETVFCNNTSTTFEGFRFEGAQNTTTWYRNDMYNHKRGMHLNNTIIGQQGALNLPIENRWLSPGSWSGTNYHTFVTQPLGSANAATLSKLFVRPPASTKPTNNWAFIPPTKYEILTPFSIVVTSGSNPVACPPVSFSPAGIAQFLANNPINTNLAKLTLEQIVLDNVPYLDYESNMRVISKQQVHRLIKQNPSIAIGNSALQNFATAMATNNISKLANTEDALAQDNLNAAMAYNNAVVPTNEIETNTKMFYSLFHKVKTTTFTPADEADLLALCNGCPNSDGTCVYQARVLYNSMHDVFIDFEDVCPISSARSQQIDVEEKTSVEMTNAIQIYPNPNTGKAIINLQETDISAMQIKIYDVNGKIVFEDKVEDATNKNYEFSIDEKSGIYFIEILDLKTETHYKQKLIIQK